MGVNTASNIFIIANSNNILTLAGFNLMIICTHVLHGSQLAKLHVTIGLHCLNVILTIQDFVGLKVCAVWK
jgi:hypothetical protein